jgi:hypothetical protein
MAKDLGFFTALIIGLSIGFAGYALLIFWIKLFFKSFDDTSKWFWRLFYIHMALWVVGALFVPIDFVEDTIHIWGIPCLVFFVLSIALGVIQKFKGQ